MNRRRDYNFELENSLFLLGDSDDDLRILLFGRESYREWAQHIRHIFVDGTFSLAPPHYLQVM